MSAPARVVVHPSKQALADGIAARLVTALIDALAERGSAEISLTGGSMGSAFITSLTRTPAAEAVDWSRVGVWWGDERYLPSGDPDRNDTQNDAAGLLDLGLDPDRVHRVAGPDRSASVEASATAYEEDLRAHGGGLFDVVILGVGPDGHIASLFPGHPASTASDGIAIAVHDSPKPPPTRVSLTRECLERSRSVWFVVSGADKAVAVRRGVDGDDYARTPAAHVHGLEETLWLVDETAASELPARA